VKGLILIVLVLGTVLVLLFLRKVRCEESRRRSDQKMQRRADSEDEA
jgi:hypothetical protein